MAIHVSKISGLSGVLAGKASTSAALPMASPLFGRPLIATRCDMHTKMTSGTTNTGQNTRLMHLCTTACADPAVTYANINVDTPNTNAITVRGSIEFPAGTFYPLFFNGRRDSVIDGGGFVTSQPVGIEIPGPQTGAINDGAATTSAFTTTLVGANISQYDVLYFTSGANAGMSLAVNTYTSGTGRITTASSFPTAPANGDTFILQKAFWTRTYVTVTAGQTWCNNVYVAGGGLQGGFNVGTSTTDQTTTGTIADSSTDTAVYGPIAITGTTTPSRVVSVVVAGDSRSEGITDSGFGQFLGYAARAVGRQFGYIKVAANGEQGATFASAHSARMLASLGATHALCDWGVNDIRFGAKTLAQIKAMILGNAALFAQRGIKVFWTTMEPETTSTDSWATAGNQTLLLTGGMEAIRTGVNDWLRDASVNGAVAQSGGAIVAVFDVAAKVEVNSSNILTQNGGFWKAGLTGDGVHGNTLGNATMCSAIDLTKFTL